MQRFLTFVVIISILLAFLFNFVEFFEKLLRVRHVQVITIAHFLWLNFIPSLFDLLPVAVWLATCLLLKELDQRNEWELLQLLTFIPKRLITFLLAMGLLVSIFTVVVYENFVSDLAFQAAHFKQEKLKQATAQCVVDKWLELDAHQLCYVGFLDLQAQQGSEIMLLFMNPTFELLKIIKAPSFFLDPKTNSVHLQRGRVFEISQAQESTFGELDVVVPSFFSQMCIECDVPTLYSGAKKLVLYRSLLPPAVYNDLLAKLLGRIGFYLQILLYPLLTLCLFLSLRGAVTRWIGALVAYPLFLMIGLIGDGAVNSGLHAFAVLVPYLLVMAGLLTWLWGVYGKKGPV